MILFVVETIQADGEISFSDKAHFYYGDAVNEAWEIADNGNVCCEQNTGTKDDFMGPCPGGCDERSPRITEYRAERVEK